MVEAIFDRTKCGDLVKKSISFSLFRSVFLSRSYFLFFCLFSLSLLFFCLFSLSLLFFSLFSLWFLFFCLFPLSFSLFRYCFSVVSLSVFLSFFFPSSFLSVRAHCLEIKSSGLEVTKNLTYIQLKGKKL
jgi:hypothetical protein